MFPYFTYWPTHHHSGKKRSPGDLCEPIYWGFDLFVLLRTWYQFGRIHRFQWIWMVDLESMCFDPWFFYFLEMIIKFYYKSFT